MTTAERLLKIVEAQANDPGLWFVAQTAPEGYLQSELRRLHAAVESLSSIEAKEMVMVPRDLISLAEIWLGSALDCKQFVWDADQHEAATQTQQQLKATLSSIEAKESVPKWYSVLEFGAICPHCGQKQGGC